MRLEVKTASSLASSFKSWAKFPSLDTWQHSYSRVMHYTGNGQHEKSMGFTVFVHFSCFCIPLWKMLGLHSIAVSDHTFNTIKAKQCLRERAEVKGGIQMVPFCLKSQHSIWQHLRLYVFWVWLVCFVTITLPLPSCSLTSSMSLSLYVGQSPINKHIFILPTLY